MSKAMTAPIPLLKGPGPDLIRLSRADINGLIAEINRTRRNAAPMMAKGSSAPLAELVADIAVVHNGLAVSLAGLTEREVDALSFLVEGLRSLVSEEIGRKRPESQSAGA